MVAVYSMSGPKSGIYQPNACRHHPLNLNPAALAVQVLLKARASIADVDRAQRSVFHWAAESANYHSINAIFASETVPPSLLDAQAFPY
jgi:hypothetical protein